MLLVDCATKQGTIDHQLKKMRYTRKVSFWFCAFQTILLFTAVLWAVIEDMRLDLPVMLLMIVMIGMLLYQWESADRKIQLLRLIRHYREED
jgi:hypothetical protein